MPQPSLRPLSPDVEHVREAIRSLRDTLLEDRKQMQYRVVFAIGLVSFTFKDLKIGESPYRYLLDGAIGVALLLMVIGSGVFYYHFYRSIGVVAALSKSLAYADLGHEDLGKPEKYWKEGKPLWRMGCAAFFLGLLAYVFALFLALSVFNGCPPR